MHSLLLGVALLASWFSAVVGTVPTTAVDDGGVARCANAETGELVYKERLGGSFYASPVRAGNAIYAVMRSSGTYVLPAAPGFEILAHNRLESDDTVFDGTPAVSRGQLFLRSGKSLYCIEK